MAEKSEKQLVVGILAHVDSGKTTLSEAMLYRAGSIRKLGRVDNKDAFLDTDTLEKARGITIFSKQALLKTGSTSITLLDTPGHVDFSTETERTLQVLDYAVLVISGTDGVQSHTETLWRLLRRYHIPTFVFINKMDLPGPGKEALLSQLSHRLGDGFVDFGAEQAERDEALALCDERLMEKMLDAGSLTAEDIIPAIARRHVFPCWFGVALQRENAGGLQGVDELLAGLDEYTRAAPALEAFGARVFKVSQDERGERLTWLRVKSPAEVVSIGDTVEVTVKDIDRENNRVSLIYKKTEDNPWEKIKTMYQVGDVVPVKIMSLTTFGAFAQIIPGIDGLIHISQIARERVEKVADKLSVGQVVDAKITELDYDRHRASLSIKALLTEEAPEEEAAEEETPAEE